MATSMYSTGSWTPPRLALAKFEKLPDSLPVMIWSPDTQMVSAAMIDPVASVPMNESIRIRTTTRLLNSPMASPATSVSRIAAGAGSLRVFSDQPTKTPAKPIVEPMERSKMPAASGITTLSAASPVIAIVITVICGEIVLYLYVKGTLTYFAPIIIFAVDYILVSITAIVIPFVKKTKTFWERSGNNYKLGPIPVISILGVVSLFYWIYVLVRGMSDSLLGANTTSNIELSVGVLLFGMIYFGIVWMVRKRQGMSLSRTYAQLPPD